MNGKLAGFALEFLRLAVQSGKAESGFTYAEIAKRKLSKYISAVDALLDEGLIERVNVGCGNWFYTITAAGLVAANGQAVGKKTGE